MDKLRADKEAAIESFAKKKVATCYIKITKTIFLNKTFFLD